MKTKKYLGTLIITGLCIGICAAVQISTIARPGGRIEVSLTAEKGTHVLGEEIGLDLTVRNASAEEMEFVAPSVMTGSLRLFISDDAKEYREYVGPRWGMLDTQDQRRMVPPAGEFSAKATVLFNRRVPTAHLNQMYAERYSKERLDREYAIPEAGSYWLKASYTVGREIYWSAPVMIEVMAPVGAEAELWERIKSDGAFGYFLQTGDIKYRPGSPQADEFLQKARQIASDHPETELARGLGTKLEKYDRMRENVARSRAERDAN